MERGLRVNRALDRVNVWAAKFLIGPQAIRPAVLGRAYAFASRVPYETVAQSLQVAVLQLGAERRSAIRGWANSGLAKPVVAGAAGTVVGEAARGVVPRFTARFAKP